MSAQPTHVRDPSLDPTASYALEPAVVRGLTDRLLATSGVSVLPYCPFNAQPLGIPQPTAADVEEALRRARRPQEQWAARRSTRGRRCCCGCTTASSTSSPRSST